MMESGARWVLVGSLVSILMMGGLGLAMEKKVEKEEAFAQVEIKQKQVEAEQKEEAITESIVLEDENSISKSKFSPTESELIIKNGAIKEQRDNMPLWKAEEEGFQFSEDLGWRLFSKRVGRYLVSPTARSGVIPDTIQGQSTKAWGGEVWVRLKWRPEIDGVEGDARIFDNYPASGSFEETLDVYYNSDFGIGRGCNISTQYSGQYIDFRFFGPVLDECGNPTGEEKPYGGIKYTSYYWEEAEGGGWHLQLTYSVDGGDPVVYLEYDHQCCVPPDWAIGAMLRGVKAPLGEYIPLFNDQPGPWRLIIARSLEGGGEEIIRRFTFVIRPVITNMRAEPNSLNAKYYDPCPEHNYNSDDFTPYGLPYDNDPYHNAVTNIRYRLANIPGGEYRVAIKIFPYDPNAASVTSIRTLICAVRAEEIEYSEKWEGIIEDDDYVGLIAPPGLYIVGIRAMDTGDINDPYTADPASVGVYIWVK